MTKIVYNLKASKFKNWRWEVNKKNKFQLLGNFPFSTRKNPVENFFCEFESQRRKPSEFALSHIHVNVDTSKLTKSTNERNISQDEKNSVRESVATS